MRVKGKVLFVKGSTVYRWRAARIEVSYDDGVVWQRFHDLQAGVLQQILMRCPLLSRLLRLGVHHFIESDSCFFVVVNKIIYQITKHGKLMGTPRAIIGGRPLCVFSERDVFYYGEYISNPARETVAIRSYDGENMTKELEINGVRHVHGVFKSSRDGARWITTGDYADEAGIWRWKKNGLERFLIGGQQSRAVQLVFSGAHIIFGTDTPLEKNFIRKVNVVTGFVEDVCEVGSSVFYGCLTGDHHFFSTVAEPSMINSTTHVELWHSKGGDEWNLIESRKKDVWPMKLFQYGQLMFPSIGEDGEYVWFYAQGVRGSGHSYRLKLSDF